MRPEIPVLLCTGYSDSLPGDHYSSIGVEGLLMKPIAMVEMAITLRNALDQASPSTEEGAGAKTE